MVAVVKPRNFEIGAQPFNRSGVLGRRFALAMNWGVYRHFQVVSRGEIVSGKPINEMVRRPDQP